MILKIKLLQEYNLKKNGKPLVDEDGYEEFLFDMDSDTFVELELDD